MQEVDPFIGKSSPSLYPNDYYYPKTTGADSEHRYHQFLYSEPPSQASLRSETTGDEKNPPRFTLKPPPVQPLFGKPYQSVPHSTVAPYAVPGMFLPPVSMTVYPPVSSTAQLPFVTRILPHPSILSLLARTQNSSAME